jgi:hypothetical protein
MPESNHISFRDIAPISHQPLQEVWHYALPDYFDVRQARIVDPQIAAKTSSIKSPAVAVCDF